MPMQTTLLECVYNPRFSLDEGMLPLEFIPQVLLNDDFDQLVDVFGTMPNPISEVEKVITPPTAGALATNNPI